MLFSGILKNIIFVKLFLLYIGVFVVIINFFVMRLIYGLDKLKVFNFFVFKYYDWVFGLNFVGILKFGLLVMIFFVFLLVYLNNWKIFERWLILIFLNLLRGDFFFSKFL